MVEVEGPEDQDLRALVVEELLALPTLGAEERGDLLVAHVAPPPEGAEDLLERLRGRLVEATGMTSLDVRHRWQRHEEWSEVWRRGLAPRRITERLVVSPSWEDPELEPGDLLVILDPGMAFGTAEHPTTRGCLRLMDRILQPGDRVADLGAGSGILSIAAARLGADEVLAVEMDPWACVVVRENLRTNGVEERVRVREARVGPDFFPQEAPFDGIVANIEAGVLTPMLPGLRSGLLDGGWLILSGIMLHEAPNLRHLAREAGFTCREADREDGWWSGLFFADGEEVPGEGPAGVA